jgi:hypothetical protein
VLEELRSRKDMCGIVSRLPTSVHNLSRLARLARSTRPIRFSTMLHCVAYYPLYLGSDRPRPAHRVRCHMLGFISQSTVVLPDRTYHLLLEIPNEGRATCHQPEPLSIVDSIPTSSHDGAEATTTPPPGVSIRLRATTSRVH